MSIVKDLIRASFPKLVHARRIKRLAALEREIRLLPFLCDGTKQGIDVGGNLGLYVHHLRKLCKNVIVFEPIPALQAHLKEQYPDVRVEGVALSDFPGQTQLRMPVGNYSWATIALTNNLELADPGSGLTSIDVTVKTLDSYDFRNVGILKIDVEGHEELVLRGASRLLSREKPNIVVEIEERHNSGSVQRVSELLTVLGYSGYFFDERLAPIRDFRIDRDQSVQNVGTVGKIGRYINNFIFVSAEKSNELAKLGSI